MICHVSAVGLSCWQRDLRGIVQKSHNNAYQLLLVDRKTRKYTLSHTLLDVQTKKAKT